MAVLSSMAALSVSARMPGRRFVIGVPTVWLLIFFLLPFLILLYISFVDMGNDVSPFKPLWVDGTLQLHYENYFSVFREKEGASFLDTTYVHAYWVSLKYASITTLLCLLLGYPFAYFIARARENARPILLVLVMLPFWTSFLLRVYAWKGLLADRGVINQILMLLLGRTEPLQMLYTDVSMLVGMTYVYLPFMILPLYSTLVKLDYRLLEAAYDLGCAPWNAFWRVTVPLSKAGIIAGSMLVFIPALGEFVIPSLLGGAENLMIGKAIYDELFVANNWPRSAALAIVMMLLILAPLTLYHKYSGERFTK